MLGVFCNDRGASSDSGKVHQKGPAMHRPSWLRSILAGLAENPWSLGKILCSPWCLCVLVVGSVSPLSPLRHKDTKNPAMNRCQNSSFSPNWITRGSDALVIRPKEPGTETLAPGAPKLAWFG